jgi:hypothetical protein
MVLRAIDYVAVVTSGLKRYYGITIFISLPAVVMAGCRCSVHHQPVTDFWRCLNGCVIVYSLL